MPVWFPQTGETEPQRSESFIVGASHDSSFMSGRTDRQGSWGSRPDVIAEGKPLHDGHQTETPTPDSA